MDTTYCPACGGSGERDDDDAHTDAFIRTGRALRYESAARDAETDDSADRFRRRAKAERSWAALAIRCPDCGGTGMATHPDDDDDCVCVCGVARSEHMLTDCHYTDGFQRRRS